MRDLNYELKQVCHRNRDGSYATQRDSASASLRKRPNRPFYFQPPLEKAGLGAAPIFGIRENRYMLERIIEFFRSGIPLPPRGGRARARCFPKQSRTAEQCVAATDARTHTWDWPRVGSRS